MHSRTLWLASALVAFQAAGCRTDFNEQPIQSASKGAPLPAMSAGPRPALQAPPKPKVGDLEDPILPGRELSGFVDGEVKTWAIKQEPSDAPRSHGKGTTGAPLSPQSPQSNAADPNVGTIPGNALSSFTNNNFNSWTISHRIDMPLEKAP